MRRLSLLVASLFVLAAIAEDEWTENPSLNSVKAPHSPRIAQLAEPSADQTNVENTNLEEEPSDAEGAFNKRARPSIGHLLGFDEADCRSGDAGCKHAILSEATSEVMGGDISWIVFKLPESGDFKAWLFTVLCVSIVLFSILFEHLLHWTRHKVMTKHGWKHVMGKIEDEFFLLGIISFVFFFCDQGIAGKNMITVEHFELAHYVLFAIGISYTYHAIAIYLGMYPSFKKWAQREVLAVRNPSEEFAALTKDDVEDKKKALAGARWAVVRKAYIDRYNLPTRFNYGEYLHQIAIDYVAEVMEATWVEWTITGLFAGTIMGITLCVYEYTSLVDTSNPHDVLMASCCAFTATGWLLLFMYGGVYHYLLVSRHRCLELLGIASSEGLMEKFSQVMNSESVSWPDGWLIDPDTDDSGDIMNKGFLATYTPQILSTFLLAFNFYVALACAIFVRSTVVSAAGPGLTVLYLCVMLAPYFLCVLFLAPRCLSVYTEIYAFQAKDEEVALELQEAQEEADRWAKLVGEKLNAAHQGNAASEFERVYGDFDENKDGFVDHREFIKFMQSLELQMSEERLLLLIDIVDPAGKGKITKDDLMYWLFPEDHEQLKKAMSPKHSKATKTEPSDGKANKTEAIDAPLLNQADTEQVV